MSEREPKSFKATQRDNSDNAGSDPLTRSRASHEDAQSKAQQDLDKLRTIINAQALNDQKQQHKDEARQYVSDVITEAINDRQIKDASVSRLLVPIVEKSVQQSITHQRKEFVDYLYPLVGSLVRKFATAFIRDFIEKTNELIENSVSLKSINWRYRAWRSGVSFSKYVASQTYVYSIHQVLLIHRETGLLLNAVSNDTFEDDNSDIVSSMLSAINDFVNDSFQSQKSSEHTEQNLDEIKTDDFTLYLRKGPQAFLVASVSGNISPIAKDKLQQTLEYIHSLYLPQLRAFEGDNAPFETVTNELSSCLLSEQISEEKANKPWLAILLFSVSIALFGYWMFIKWETSQALEVLSSLPSDQGIIVTSAKVAGLKSIEATVLRDPAAPLIEEWLSTSSLDGSWLSIKEQAFVSLDTKIIASKIQKLIIDYNGITYSAQQNIISGELSSMQTLLFKDALQKIPGITQLNPKLDIQQLSLNGIQKQAQDNASQQAMTIMAGEITQLQISFALASSEVAPSQQAKLILIVNTMRRLKEYAKTQNLEVKLLILGTSDNIGAQDVNRRLSLERAQKVSLALQGLGLAKADLMTAGLGIIEDASSGTDIRKAIINVVYNNVNE